MFLCVVFVDGVVAGVWILSFTCFDMTGALWVIILYVWGFKYCIRVDSLTGFVVLCLFVCLWAILFSCVF